MKYYGGNNQDEDTYSTNLCIIMTMLYLQNSEKNYSRTFNQVGIFYLLNLNIPKIMYEIYPDLKPLFSHEITHKLTNKSNFINFK